MHFKKANQKEIFTFAKSEIKISTGMEESLKIKTPLFQIVKRGVL
jgi:hypothetical protein